MKNVCFFKNCHFPVLVKAEAHKSPSSLEMAKSMVTWALVHHCPIFNFPVLIKQCNYLEFFFLLFFYYSTNCWLTAIQQGKLQKVRGLTSERSNPEWLGSDRKGRGAPAACNGNGCKRDRKLREENWEVSCRVSRRGWTWAVTELHWALKYEDGSQ